MKIISSFTGSRMEKVEDERENNVHNVICKGSMRHTHTLTMNNFSMQISQM